MNEHLFDISLGLVELQALSYAVEEAIRLWPGAPARPYEEQEVLDRLKKALFAMRMEVVLQEDGDKTEP